MHGVLPGNRPCQNRCLTSGGQNHAWMKSCKIPGPKGPVHQDIPGDLYYMTTGTVRPVQQIRLNLAEAEIQTAQVLQCPLHRLYNPPWAIRLPRGTLWTFQIHSPLRICPATLHQLMHW